MWVDGKEETNGESKGIVKELCKWPTYHNDVREVLAKGTYFDVPMGMTETEGSKTRAGRRWTNLWLNVDTKEGIKKVNQ